MLWPIAKAFHKLEMIPACQKSATVYYRDLNNFNNYQYYYNGPTIPILTTEAAILYPANSLSSSAAVAPEVRSSHPASMGCFTVTPALRRSAAVSN